MALSAVNFVTALISVIAAVIYSGQTPLVIQKLNELLHWRSGCNPHFSVGNVTLHYFTGRGRAEAIRLLMEDQLIPYTEIRYTKDQWPITKAGDVANLYTFGQLPAIITKNKNLVQSKVILQYLGRSVGLDCDCKDLERCDLIAAGVDDLNNKRYSVLYDPKFNGDTAENYIVNTFRLWLMYFEELAPHQSTESEGLYFSSDRITWVDYLVFEMLDANFNLARLANPNNSDMKLLESFPRLLSFYKHFKDRTKIASYLRSDRRPLFTIPYPLKS